MDFVLVFKRLLRDFRLHKVDCALIGGFALQAAGIARTTGDIDMLISAQDKEKAKSILLKYGYELIHESADVLNFASDDARMGRLDFLLAHRKYATAMLKRAQKKGILGGRFQIKVIRVEDQIGLKVQSSSNDPSRLWQDMADIKALIKNNYPKLDLPLLREYFSLFGRRAELERIFKEVRHA
jgi:predicted nucleotidyltransferase